MKIITLICAICLFISSLRAQMPVGEVSPTSLDFGPTLVGCTSPQKRVALKNTGDAQLVMDSISITGLFAMPVNHCARGVKPETHCDVYLTYSPDRLETNTGTLTFNDNASNSPQVVPLSGYGATIVPTASKMEKPSPSGIRYGQTTTLAATVTSLGGCTIPDGEAVTFHNNMGFVYCTAPTLAGRASCTAQVFAKPSIYYLHASYPGDAQFEPSESPGIIRLFVSKWESKTTLIASPNPTQVGQPVTLTATVSNSGGITPTGRVRFSINGISWRITLADGIAQTSHTFPIAGNWTIYAYYTGDIGNVRSSTTLTEVVNP